MTNDSLENDLKRYYARFEEGHDFQRERLLASLDKAPRATASRGAALILLRKAAGAAACLLIVIGGIYLLTGGDNSQEAFASAINKFSQVQSVHLRMVTPNRNADASVEMWWRRPHDFRQEFGDGTIIAANREKRYTFNPQNQQLKIIENTGPGPEMLILGEMGRLFTEEEAFVRKWIDNSTIKKTEAVNYRGEECRKITCHKDGYQYEYIIDARAQGDRQAPFYEVKVYGDYQGEKLLSHMEVLEVDADLPDRLFVIEPGPDIK
ncbi:MAG: hypothetical protein AMJ79_08135 [Phycisphaerae bacterium SM23_30]|nr:MAG: hypothetical protein AMJ79_08135 [Phycisphaerae bacterium SM23_30]